MIKEWIEIDRLAKKTSNLSMAKKYDLLWLFYSLLLFYVVSSAITIYLVYLKQMSAATLLILITILLMQLTLNLAFFRKFDDLLKGATYSKRLLYFRYLTFREEFNSSEILKTEDIPKLLRWAEIEIQKPENSNFFATKIFTVPATGLLAFVLGALSKVSLLPLDVIFVVVLGFGSLSIASSVFEIFKAGQHRQVTTKRFLEWLELDPESAALRDCI